MYRQYLAPFYLSILLTFGCSEQEQSKVTKGDQIKADTTETSSVDNSSVSEPQKTPKDFVPEGFVNFKEVYGDLNGDGLQDCALIIKGTDKNKIIQDEYRGELDRNRRGIIILLNNKNGYEVAAKNYTCFSSENEDGGVYFPPELVVDIVKGKLVLHYAHGRYGYWKYTFRYQQGKFLLIGYDQSDSRGPVEHYFYSYNFLTSKKLTKENINFETEHPENEVFEETWEELPKNELINLATVKDFDELSFD